jgi:hypothetical protein
MSKYIIKLVLSIPFVLFIILFGIAEQSIASASGINLTHYPQNWSELSVYKMLNVSVSDSDIEIRYKIIDHNITCNNAITEFSSISYQYLYISSSSNPSLSENKKVCIQTTDPNTNNIVYTTSQIIPEGSVLSHEISYFPNNDWSKTTAEKGIHLYTSASEVYYDFLTPDQACNISTNLSFEREYAGILTIDVSNPSFVEGKKICIRMVFSNKTVHAESIIIPFNILEYEFIYSPEDLETPSHSKSINFYSRYRHLYSIIPLDATCDNNVSFTDSGMNSLYKSSNNINALILANEKICIKIFFPNDNIVFVTSDSYSSEVLLPPILKYTSRNDYWGDNLDWNEPTLYKSVELITATYNNKLVIINSGDVCNHTVNFDDSPYWYVNNIDTRYRPEFTENTKLCYRLTDELNNIHYLESLPILSGTLPNYIFNYDDNWNIPSLYRSFSINTLGPYKYKIVDGNVACDEVSEYIFMQNGGNRYITSYSYKNLVANKKMCFEITLLNNSIIYAESTTIQPENQLLLDTAYYPENWSTPSVPKTLDFFTIFENVWFGVFDADTECDDNLDYTFAAGYSFFISNFSEPDLTVGKKVCVKFEIDENTFEFYSSQIITNGSITDHDVFYSTSNIEKSFYDASHDKAIGILTYEGNSIFYKSLAISQVCNNSTLLTNNTQSSEHSNYIPLSTFDGSINGGEKVCFRIKFANGTFSNTYVTDNIVNLYGYDLDPIESIVFTSIDKYSQNMNITLKPDAADQQLFYYQYIDNNQTCNIDTLTEIKTECYDGECFTYRAPKTNTLRFNNPNYAFISSVEFKLDSHVLNGKKMCFSFNLSSIYTSPIISGLVEKKDFTSSPDRGGIFNSTEQSTEE